MADPDSVARLVHAAADALGPIEILINSAGVIATSALEDCPDDEWRRVLAVNLDGEFHLCRAVPAMQARRSGRIVNIASTAARDPRTLTGAAYVAAKAGVLAITRQLAHRLAPEGITVNAVAPGPIDTDMPRTAFSPAVLLRTVEAVPAGRMGTAEEVAAAVAYLISDEAAFVTGATLYVAGGVWIE